MREIKFRFYWKRPDAWAGPYSASDPKVIAVEMSLDDILNLRSIEEAKRPYPKVNDAVKRYPQLKDGEYIISRYKILVDRVQYIGLKDKNGKEIYEGDIIKDTLGEHYWIYVIKPLGGQFGNNLWAITIKHNVSINETENRYTYQEVMVDGCNRNTIPYGDRVEVIGNIYESPELLETK